MSAVKSSQDYKTLSFPAVFEKSFKRVEDASKYLIRLKNRGIDADYLSDEVMGKDAHTVVSTVRNIGEFIAAI